MPAKKLSKKQQELKSSWEDLLNRHSAPLFSKHKARVGTSRSSCMPVYSYRDRDALRSTPSLTSKLGIVSKPSIMDPMTLAKERPEVAEAIIQKSKRLAPAYSKGAYQYVTDGTDPADLGRKR
jgi:hypothetical protein